MTKRFLPFALALLSGCASTRDASETQRASREKAEASASAAKSQGADVQGALLKDSGFSGSDDRGRPLWSIGAREIRVANSQDESVPGLAPRRATLSRAWAKLFRAGKLESSLSAPRIEYAQAKSGDLITLVGQGAQSVTVRSSGALAPQLGALVLRAPRIEVAPKTRELLAPSGAQAFGARRKVSVSATKLRADSDLGTLRMSGGIRASSPQGALQADAGVWNWKTERALATGNVRASHAGTTISGARVVADLDAKRGQITGDKTPVTARARDGATASAPRVRFNWAANEIEGSGGVLLSRDGGTLRAPRLQADTSLRRATASGGVTLQKDGATFSALQIQAFDKLSRAVASGNVRLQKDGAIMTATRVQAFDNFSRAVATGSVRLSKDGAILVANQVQAFEKLSRASASGGVRLTREGSTLTASRLDARDNYQTATASGSVRLSRADFSISSRAATARNLRDEQKISVEAQGSVEARSPNATVRASRVVWSGGKSGLISASGGVTLAREGHTLNAPRALAQLGNARLTSGVLSGGVRARLADGTRLTAQSATYTVGNERVLARGGVVATRPNATLRAGEMEARMRENLFLLSDGVRVTTTDGVTVTAQGARYDRARDVLTTSGTVFFADAKRNLRGTGRALTITNFSKPSRRAVLDNSLLTAPGGALGGLKVF